MSASGMVPPYRAKSLNANDNDEMVAVAA